MANQEPDFFFQGPCFEGTEFPPFTSLVKNAAERIDELKTFSVRPGDVLLTTFPKSGTHWFFEMLSMLKTGKAEYTRDMLRNSLEVVESIAALDDLPSPRILISHMPFRYLPEVHRLRGAKVIHVVRNPKDVYVSLFHHFNSSCIKQLPWSTYVDNILNGRGHIFDGWFKYEKEFEQASKDNGNTQIHTVYYEDMQKNPVEELQNIAKFLEIECDKTLLVDIVEKCGFDKMKQVDGDRNVKSHEVVDKIMDEMEGFQQHPTIFRKGKVGDWRNLFTVAQNEDFDALLECEMQDSKLKF